MLIRPAFLALASLSLAFSAPAATVTALAEGGTTDGGSFSGPITLGTDNRLYVAASAGGVYSKGAIVSMKPDGSDRINFANFNGSNGASPNTAPIQASDGNFYGGTLSGGANDKGVIYFIKGDGTQISVLHDFSGTSDGEAIYGSLIEGADGRIYGTARDGGMNNGGTLFRMDKDGSNFSVLVHFANGANPYCGVIQLASGRLYGLLAGPNDGALFTCETSGTNYAEILTFDGTNGSTPVAPLLDGGDGFLYGVTFSGGTLNGGVIFRVKPDGTGYKALRSLDTQSPADKNGFNSTDALAFGPDGRLYGSASSAGSGTRGVLFSLDTDGSDFKVLHTFLSADTSKGADPNYLRLTLLASGDFVGTCYRGGSSNLGTVFKLSPGYALPKVTISPKPPRKTSKSSLVIKGKASGAIPIARVEYAVGKGSFRAASGKATWSFRAVLKMAKKGKNVFRIRATDTLGRQSTPVTLTLTRTVKKPAR